jgi:hypothetical protein
MKLVSPYRVLSLPDLLTLNQVVTNAVSERCMLTLVDVPLVVAVDAVATVVVATATADDRKLSWMTLM